MMVLIFHDVLSPELTARLCSLLRGGAPAVSEAAAAVVQALRSHPLVTLGLQPRRLSQPVFRRHDVGMGSAPSVADAMAGDDAGFRADAGIIVFLSDASEYDGGEVVIDTGAGDESIRIGAGGCVIYPAWARCGFAPVMRGVRWTAELQAQSLVRGAQEREILYDIGYSLHLMRLFTPNDDPDVAKLDACSRNLLRILAEP